MYGYPDIYGAFQPFKWVGQQWQNLKTDIGTLLGPSEEHVKAADAKWRKLVREHKTDAAKDAARDLLGLINNMQTYEPVRGQRWAGVASTVQQWLLRPEGSISDPNAAARERQARHRYGWFETAVQDGVGEVFGWSGDEED